MAKFLDDLGLRALWAKTKELFSGAGDMQASIYDPQGRGEDVFAAIDAVESNSVPLITAIPLDGGTPGVDYLADKEIPNFGLFRLKVTKTTESVTPYLHYADSSGTLKKTVLVRFDSSGVTVTKACRESWLTSNVTHLVMREAARSVVLSLTQPNASDIRGIIAPEHGALGIGTIPAGSYIVGNGTEPVQTKTPAEVLEDIGAAPKDHAHTAADVTFTDGETFQGKLDAGKLTGPTGKDGATGKSAYQQAVDAGYTGTEAAFYAALVSLKDGPFLPTKGGTMTGDISFIDDSVSEKPLVVGAIDRNDSSGYSGIKRAGADISFADDGFIILSGAQVEINTELAVYGAIYANGGRVMDVGNPTAPADAANKGYVDSKALVFTAKTVPTTAWSTNTTYSAQGYGFRAAVACAGVTASHRPDVAFGAADAVSGNFAPFADSYAGGVYIYCKTKPTATVTIPSIVCIKGV